MLKWILSLAAITGLVLTAGPAALAGPDCPGQEAKAEAAQAQPAKECPKGCDCPACKGAQAKGCDCPQHKDPAKGCDCPQHKDPAKGCDCPQHKDHAKDCTCDDCKKKKADCPHKKK